MKKTNKLDELSNKSDKPNESCKLDCLFMPIK